MICVFKRCGKNRQGYIGNFTKHFIFGHFLIAERMSYFDGMEFSTWDYDRYYRIPGYCGMRNQAGWWYKECHQGNLNGLYGVQNTTGICWLMTTGIDTNFVFPSHVIMMVMKSS